MDNSFRKVLVTGGSGCVGMQVCNVLAEKGVDVVQYDLFKHKKVAQRPNINFFEGSILDSTALRDAMADCDGVIHLAAHLGVQRTEVNRLRCLDINIDGTRKVLDEATRARKCKKFIFASSSEVYGEPLQNPISESHMTQGKTVYGISKLAGEEMVKAYHSDFGTFDYSILRYFNSYGPYQIGQFVITRFVSNVMQNKAPVVFGNGHQIRSYCHASDTAHATSLALLSSSANQKTLNIGNSLEPISLVDLAKKVIAISGNADRLEPHVTQDFVETDRLESREIHNRICDTSLARSILGFKPKVSLDTGLEELLARGLPAESWSAFEKSYK